MVQIADDNDFARVTSTNPGVLPNSNIEIIRSVSFGNVVEGGGTGNAPSVEVGIDIAPAILSSINSITVTLKGPNGRFEVQTADASDGDNLELIEVPLGRQSVSGEWEISEIKVSFNGDPAVTGFPSDGLTIEPNEISSLIDDRFIDLTNPDEDRIAPTVSGIDVPIRSIAIDGDLISGNSVEITFDGIFNDENSGLNIIEFEFDIGPGSPAVIGTAFGLFGDLRNGERQLSTLNSTAPTGSYRFELLRVSDDQGNTVEYSQDDLASLGFNTLVHVVDLDALQDTSSPSVESISFVRTADIIDDNITIEVDGTGGEIAFELTATDTGSRATGVQTVTVQLTSSADGALYSFVGDVTFTSGDQGEVSIALPSDLPGGEYSFSVQVNDGAFNSFEVPFNQALLSVINPLGGNTLANRIRGDEADNFINARAGDDFVVGGLGSDSVLLGDGNDTSFAGAGDLGNDTVIGGRGDDIIGGAAGDDLLIGGRLLSSGIQTQLFQALDPNNDGSDTLFGGDGNDTLYGGNPFFDEDETIEEARDFGSEAADNLWAGSGDDWAQGSFGNDNVGGGTGNDTLRGGAGDDILYGGRDVGNTSAVNDQLFGEEGHDTIFAGAGNDSVSGGADNDTLFGGAGNDTIWGDGGRDEIFGGTGDDRLTGGSGADIFFFRPGSGSDVITDFDITEDQLVLSQYADRFSNVAAIRAQSVVTVIDGQSGVLINLGEDDQIFLEGVTALFTIDIVL